MTPVLPVVLGLAGQIVRQDAADALFKDALSPVDGQRLGNAWGRYAAADELFSGYLRAEPAASEERRAALWAKAEAVGGRTARSGWEMVVAPVKSFSILWGTADDEGRARLEAVHVRAREKAFEMLQAQACLTRTGPTPASQVQERANGFIGAVFTHRSSRAGDPEFHDHVMISSKVRTADGRWLGLDARQLHRLIVTANAYYTAELERGM